MEAITELLPELIVRIAAACDPASAVALKYTCKLTHGILPIISSAHDTMAIAAYNGHLPQVKWLYSLGCTQLAVSSYGSTATCGFGQDRICVAAAHGGHFPVLYWLHSKKFTITPEVAHGAAFNGDIATLEWIRSKGNYYGYQSTFEILAALGHLLLLEWLYDTHHVSMQVHNDVIAVAATAGHLHILEWLINRKKCYYSRQIIWAAAYNGHLEIVQRLIAAGHLPMHARRGATKGKQKAILEYLDAHCPTAVDHDSGLIMPWETLYDVNSPSYILNRCRIELPC